MEHQTYGVSASIKAPSSEKQEQQALLQNTACMAAEARSSSPSQPIAAPAVDTGQSPAGLETMQRKVHAAGLQEQSRPAAASVGEQHLNAGSMAHQEADQQPMDSQYIGDDPSCPLGPATAADAASDYGSQLVGPPLGGVPVAAPGQLQQPEGAQDADTELDAAVALASMAASSAHTAAAVSQDMALQQPSSAMPSSYGSYGSYHQYGNYQQQLAYHEQAYQLQGWQQQGYTNEQDWQQQQQQQRGSSSAAKRASSGTGSKANNDYYRQKLAEILREADREHELPRWDVQVSHRPKNGKPDAVYIGPDGTRYKSRAILRDRLGLGPGPGARKAKIVQQQQLQAAMAATAAANAAAAADPSLLTQHFAAYSGSIEPNASSLSIPATSSYQSDQPSSLSAGAAAAAAGTAGPVVRQQQQIESPAAAGSGPEWYKNVVQLTGDVAAALEPAMRGQYKVIHILRCPFIAGYVVEYCRRTTKGSVRNQLPGRISADGNITCGCSKCNWMVDIPTSMFEEHSLSTVRRPAQFIYIIGPQDSEGHILANHNITLKELLALVNSATSSSGTGCSFTDSKHCRHCMQCSEPGAVEDGEWLECAGCPLAYHAVCLGIQGVVARGAEWYCPYCLQAGREPAGYRDGQLHRMCQQAVINNRQLPKQPPPRQHHSGARALDQMLVPPPPATQVQQRPAYSSAGNTTASTPAATAAAQAGEQSQQQQQQHSGPAMSTNPAAAGTDSAAAASAATGDDEEDVSLDSVAAAAVAPQTSAAEDTAPAAAEQPKEAADTSATAAATPAGSAAAVAEVAAESAGAAFGDGQQQPVPAVGVSGQMEADQQTMLMDTVADAGPVTETHGLEGTEAADDRRGLTPQPAEADQDMQLVHHMDAAALAEVTSEPAAVAVAVPCLPVPLPLVSAPPASAALEQQQMPLSAVEALHSSVSPAAAAAAPTPHPGALLPWEQKQQQIYSSSAFAGASSEHPNSSNAETGTQIQFQPQLSRRSSSGNVGGSGSGAAPYRINAPKPRLPSAARHAVAAAAAASGDTSAVSGDSDDHATAAAAAAGSVGGQSPSYTFKRRTPQDMRRMIVRNLHALIGPYTEAAWQEHIKRGTTRGAQPSQWQCEAFMAQVLGDRQGPNAVLWPTGDELRPDGVMKYLARVIHWASGVSLTAEQVNNCFVPGEHVWKVNDDKLVALGLYPWNWTLPLNKEQVATTTEKPTRDELAPVAAAAVAAAAAKMVAAVASRYQLPRPAAVAAAAAVPTISSTTATQTGVQPLSASGSPAGSSRIRPQLTPISAGAAAVRPSAGSTSSGLSPAASPVGPFNMRPTAAGMPAAAGMQGAPGLVPRLVPQGSQPALLTVPKPPAAVAAQQGIPAVSSAAGVPGLPSIGQAAPGAASAAMAAISSTLALQRLTAAGLLPGQPAITMIPQQAATAAGQSVGPALTAQWYAAAGSRGMPVAISQGAAAPVGGIAPGTGVKILQGVSTAQVRVTPQPGQPAAAAAAAQQRSAPLVQPAGAVKPDGSRSLTPPPPAPTLSSNAGNARNQPAVHTADAKPSTSSAVAASPSPSNSSIGPSGALSASQQSAAKGREGSAVGIRTDVTLQEAMSQAAALVTALQRAGASAKGATAAAAAAGLLPPQSAAAEVSAAAAVTSAAADSDHKPDMPQQEDTQLDLQQDAGMDYDLEPQGASLDEAVVPVNDSAAVQQTQRVVPKLEEAAAYAAAAAAVAARQQLLAAQQQQQQLLQQPLAVDGRGPMQPAASQSAALKHHFPASAADAAADVGGQAGSGPSKPKKDAKPVEIKRCIVRQMRLVFPHADAEYQAVCNLSSKRTTEQLNTVESDLFLEKVLGRCYGDVVLPRPSDTAQELSSGNIEQGAAHYMARLLSCCFGKTISPEEYKQCVTKQGTKWAVHVEHFTRLGIAPWELTTPINQHISAAASRLVNTTSNALADAAFEPAAIDTEPVAAATGEGRSAQVQGSGDATAAAAAGGEGGAPPAVSETLPAAAGLASAPPTPAAPAARLASPPAPDVTPTAAAAAAAAVVEATTKPSWGQPPAARPVDGTAAAKAAMPSPPPPPTAAATAASGDLSSEVAARVANTDAHVQKLRQLNQLMKRKYSLDQEDQEDPLVQAKEQGEALERYIKRMLLLQRSLQEQHLLADEQQKLAGTRASKDSIIAAQERLRGEMAAKDQQQQQHLHQLEQEVLGGFELGEVEDDQDSDIDDVVVI